ncbi:MAG: translation initiation factor IF-2 [Chloroflexi bacterium]|nr:translation initiation factor IF-2 [Chloroflexota bacterium]
MRTVPLPETATIAQIAERAEVESTDIIVELLSRNVLATINAAIDRDTARAVLAKLGVDVTDEETAAPPAAAEVKEAAPADDEAPAGEPRPPVVTVMGHVDHGKTTLLDAIRQTQVALGEHGGITQSIGAYQVTTGEGAITFIDTPGHEAFTAMRARGAGVTDIVVVVVAADDGVMPQTVEAIGHARAAGVPMIMAVNKIDLPTANPERAYQQLTEHEVVVEAYGGDVVAVPLSAEQGDGIDELLEYINLTAQLEELRAPVDGPAVATVIETRLDRSQGPIASAIVTSGTLSVGDQVQVGNVEGRVRALFDHHGERLKQAGPSTPVQVVGLESTPAAGDQLRVAKRSKRRRRAERSAAQRGGGEQAIRLSLEQLAAQMTAGQLHQLSVVVKASTDGAAAAVVKSLADVGEARTRAVVIYEGVGTITESDVNLAAAAEGIVVGFDVRIDPAARAEADRQGVDVRVYFTIYELIDEVDAALRGMLEPEEFEVVDGRLEIRGEFRSERTLQIVGGMVLTGRIYRGADVRILRRGEEIGQGRIGTVRRFADAVEEVREGFDCGLGVQTTTNIELADIIEVFHTETRQP